MQHFANRTTCAALCLGLAALSACVGPSGGPSTDVNGVDTQPPNILLISLDACRPDRLGCYGHSRNTSPFIDSLAASGIRFESAFINTHGTPPSHTTMFSSLYQEQHGVQLDGAPPDGQVDRIPASVFMVQEILRGNGYITVGVSGGGNMNRKIGFGRGFVEYDDRPGRASAQKNRLLELVDRHHDPARPLYMLYHTYEVHSPYQPPAPWDTHFGVYPSTVEPTSEFLLSIVNEAATALDDDDINHLLALYDGGIRFTDTVLEDLFAALEARGILDSTLVIITADHGEEFGEHGGLLHRGTLYEELVRVPLIMWGAGVPKDVVDQRLVSSIDLMPTILAAAGVEAPRAVAGRDLLSPDAAPLDENLVFLQYGRRLYGVRSHRWKLIENTAKDSYELYDLETDPAELVNRYSEQLEVAAELSGHLEDWKSSIGEPRDPTSAELSREELEQLEALGYVDGAMPDPK
jgi:arylsulfatase A-like enzyme